MFMKRPIYRSFFMLILYGYPSAWLLDDLIIPKLLFYSSKNQVRFLQFLILIYVSFNSRITFHDSIKHYIILRIFIYCDFFGMAGLELTILLAHCKRATGSRYIPIFYVGIPTKSLWLINA